MNRSIRLAGLMFVCTGWQPASGAAISFTPVADTAITENPGTPSGGATPTLVAGSLSPTGGSAKNRALLRFDLVGAMPADATIDSVAVSLTVVRVPPGGPGSEFGLHAMLRSWTELGATWNGPTPLESWAEPGGRSGVDWDSAMSGSVFVDDVGAYEISSTPALVADVQRWLSDPAANFGWMLRSDSELLSQTARHFASRENLRVNPTLTVRFEPISEPSSLAVFLLGLAVIVACRQCRPSGSGPCVIAGCRTIPGPVRRSSPPAARSGWPQLRPGRLPAGGPAGHDEIARYATFVPRQGN
jgi:hypothetical protein